MASVKTNIVQIGDSQGILIPKHLLEQCHLQEEVELEPRGNYLIIKALTAPRVGWDEMFRKMAEKGDDAMLDEDTSLETKWDREEWQWQLNALMFTWSILTRREVERFKKHVPVSLFLRMK